MADSILLYHGTIYDFNIIDVSKGKGNKDFGRGFYTTRDVGHARRLAYRTMHIENERLALRGLSRSATSWLYEFSFDLDNLSTLNTKEFQVADREWMRFVVLNRESKSLAQEHEYDIVIGPTANDNTRAAIQTIIPLSNGSVTADRALDALITLIEPDNLPWQFFFGTQLAADLLTLNKKRKI